MTVFKCKCGGELGPHHKVNGMAWRAHPSRLEPMRQWAREYLRSDYVIVDPDMMIRHYDSDNPIGVMIYTEIKSHGAPIGVKNIMTARCVATDETSRGFWAIQMDGNVPTALQHWPEPCDCGCIVEEVVSTNVYVQRLDTPTKQKSLRLEPKDLVAWIDKQLLEEPSHVDH